MQFGKLPCELKIRKAMNKKYLIIKQSGFYINNFYENLQKYMKGDFMLLKTEKEKNNIILYKNVFGIIQNISSEELVWGRAQYE